MSDQRNQVLMGELREFVHKATSDGTSLEDVFTLFCMITHDEFLDCADHVGASGVAEAQHAFIMTTGRK